MNLMPPTSQNIEHIRHSLAHLLAAAVLKEFPDAKLAIGPVIENGFYYDFELPRSLAPEDLATFEKTMRKLAAGHLPFSGKKVNVQEAKKIFKNQPFKLELIDELEGKGEDISIYETGTVFSDLCRGGHVENTSEIPLDAFKLDKIAGAYWRGDEKNPMLQRIYGLAFGSKQELDDYLAMRAEAEKRDHRKLGKGLDLFTFSEYIGSGLPLYTPRGAFIRLALNNYIEELQSKAGYAQVWTPQIAKAELFKISGHYDKYKDDMFRVVSNYSDEEFFLKPMNCPQHTQIYNSQPRSYRDLPLRYTDFAMLYRDEKPGELNGLARVRSFSQDDCHIFCREDQVDQEIDVALEMTKRVMNTFGFKYRYRLSTRDKNHPEKYLGHPATWDKVEKWAEKIMKRNNIDYFDGPGEAAFYAPKMDLMATDALGREWQLSTVQIDFVQPERFQLSYTDQNGEKKTPVMIHRAIIGSPERFIMILLEHFAGAFPLWLAPTQVAILPVSDKFSGYGKSVHDALLAASIRSELGDANESLGKRIRAAEMMKIPYVIVVGEKEEKAKTVNFRTRGSEEKTAELKLDAFIEKLVTETKEKKL
jgi:threonyl-tRNA synthetase